MLPPEVTKILSESQFQTSVPAKIEALKLEATERANDVRVYGKDITDSAVENWAFCWWDAAVKAAALEWCEAEIAFQEEDESEGVPSRKTVQREYDARVAYRAIRDCAKRETKT